MKFAHRSFLVDVANAKGKGIIETQNGSLIVGANDLILTDQNGKQEVVSEKAFLKQYIAVEEVVEKEDLANAYAEALQGFSLDSYKEDEEYLSKTAEMHGIRYT